MKLHLTFFLTLLISLNAVSQSNKKDIIDTFIKQQLKTFIEVPSIAIAVVKDNKQYFIKTYGKSDVDKNISVTKETPYYIASVTKSYVALLAEILAEEGKIDLNTSITQYEPIKSFKDNSLFKDVTITNLLSHTSGIENIPLGRQLTAVGEFDDKLLNSILEHETISLHNRKSYRYTNFGYYVFAMILKAELGKDWKTFLDKKVIQPLGLRKTTASLTKANKNSWKLAQPYTAINDKRLPTKPNTLKKDKNYHAAGGMLASLEDFQKWLLVHMNDGTLNGKQIFSKEVVQSVHKPKTRARGRSEIFTQKGYGLGWQIGDFGKRRVIYHSGGFDGYFASVSFMPKENLGVVIMANESHMGDNVSRLIVSFVYDLLLGEVNAISDYPKDIAAVKKRVDRLQMAFAQDKKRRSTRQWKLSRPLKYFEGEYVNPLVGTIKVKIKGGKPYLSYGVANDVLGEPTFYEDVMRVEFRDKNASEIQFVFYSNKRAALVYGKNVYHKK